MTRDYDEDMREEELRYDRWSESGHEDTDADVEEDVIRLKSTEITS